MQGITFLDTMYSILNESIKKLHQDKMNFELKNWLILLLRLINIEDSNSGQYLELFLRGQQPVLQIYHGTLRDYVSRKICNK